MMSVFDKNEQAKRAALYDQTQVALGATKPVLPMPPIRPAISQGARDMLGTKINVGNTVARAVSNSRGTFIRVCKVTGTDAGKVYLDNSVQVVKHPERLLILP
jgi:hypothetical protein